MSERTRHYDDEQRYWDSRSGEAYVSLSAIDAARVRDWIAWNGDGLCLDLGAGSGMVARVLGEAARADVVGLDISAGLLRHARPPVVQGDALALPFRDESFTLVVAAALFHHLPGRESELLRECRRVLKPGGRLVGYDPSADCIQNRLFMGSGALRLRRFSPDELPIRPAALEADARSAGFRDFRFARLTFRNAVITAFERVQRYVLEPIARGPFEPWLKRWFLWEARK